MAEYTTPNGVRITFENNDFVPHPYDAPPLLTFDMESNLTSICFDGYEIRSKAAVARAERSGAEGREGG